jgi:hypothetical protein
MIDYSALPESLQGGLQLYIEDKIPPGSFLKALLMGNLLLAKECADVYNKPRINEIVLWLSMNIPPECWGSEEAYINWLQKDDKAT